ncbi:amino acid/amide ABC transporter substrate-binding protein (HAAT family) [Aneurinibacillus soli]|uniref:Leucine-, isoleucine-, valine-, threonine-, and alanine-binding protein n=1 Tax=Aneurinibacillus soli TaxID=1500254 RepID=A0A0U5BFC1_9BACL|nr:ABC transporter substrate-binding protein [Aneurinibacillus soli]PYE60958.1 amino acid/amide ABC transporter substrate-binding protein (HAAT family) [Aneurinibacillus soli]BAU26862.1 Leucine-, isoleucine-, valine-, threonine-, and alanine-binding protein precursor [Aneurinibacillus soli]
MKMKKWFAPVMAASLVMLSACGGGGGQTSTKSQATSGSASDSIKVGAVFSMTGANSPLGVPEKQAVEMLVKEINKNGGVNNKQLEVLFEDDKSDNTEAVKAMKKLVTSEHVVAVLGSSGSGPSLGMAEYAAAQKVPMISMAAANKITNPVRAGIFKTPHTDIHGTKRIYKYLKEKGISKVAVLYDSNPYGSGWAVQLKKFAPEYGITITAEEKYGTKDPSMSSQLTKIKGTDAQALIIAGTNPGPSTIVKEAKQLGLSIPIISSHGSANGKFIELAGDAANGVLLVAGKMLVSDQISDSDPQAKIVKKFVADYKTTYNTSADGFAGYGYDGLNILVEALKAAGGDAAKLPEALEKVNYVGVTGEFKFSPQDHNGLSEDSMIMVQVKDGKFQVVK